MHRDKRQAAKETNFGGPGIWGRMSTSSGATSPGYFLGRKEVEPQPSLDLRPHLQPSLRSVADSLRYQGGTKPGDSVVFIRACQPSSVGGWAQATLEERSELQCRQRPARTSKHKKAVPGVLQMHSPKQSTTQALKVRGNMSSTVTETATQTITLSTSNALKLDGTPTNFGDWRDDLSRDGYAVIKGAIPRDRALKYSDTFYRYIEDL